MINNEKLEEIANLLHSNSYHTDYFDLCRSLARELLEIRKETRKLGAINKILASTLEDNRNTFLLFESIFENYKNHVNSESIALDMKNFARRCEATLDFRKKIMEL